MKIQKNQTKGIISAIGNTPLIKFDRLSDELGFNVFGKMENMNPGGSLKDRSSLNILRKAFERGQISKDTTVVESSSGNMALGLAQACRYFSMPLVVVVDPLINKQTLAILKTFGVKIIMVEKPSADGGYLQARLNKVQDVLRSVNDSFWPDQYHSQANPEAHGQTMQEIIENLNGNVDFLFAATSTCGTITGCAQMARNKKLDTKVIAVDAFGSVLFGQKPSKRLIPGHGASRTSAILDINALHDVVIVNDHECVKGCRELLLKEAVLAGGSSGAVVSGIKKYADKIPSGANCVLIICDSGERYLNTIYSDAWVTENLSTTNNNQQSEPCAIYE